METLVNGENTNCILQNWMHTHVILIALEVMFHKTCNVTFLLHQIEGSQSKSLTQKIKRDLESRKLII